MIHEVVAVVRHEFRVVRRDIQPYVALIIMPLLLMAFIKPAFATEGRNGSEQAVPGMTVMFSLFLVGNVGIAFFREHGWRTWDRLRASWVRPASIMAGKIVTPLLLLVLQMTLLFAVGGALFDLRLDGSPVALGLVGLSFALALVFCGIWLVALCRSVMQMNAFSNIGTLALAGLGGALTPLASLPDWARTLSPITPSYWAMSGFTQVIVDGGSATDVLRHVAVLLAFAAFFAMVAARRFRFEEAKTHWS